MSLDLPSPEVLHKILRYDPSTGVLEFKKRRSDMFLGFPKPKQSWGNFNLYKANSPALTTPCNGYLVGHLWLHPYKDRAFYAHRVAWVMMTNEPIGPLDIVKHINAKRDDNRFSNLRLVRGGQS